MPSPFSLNLLPTDLWIILSLFGYSTSFSSSKSFYGIAMTLVCPYYSSILFSFPFISLTCSSLPSSLSLDEDAWLRPSSTASTSKLLLLNELSSESSTIVSPVLVMNSTSTNVSSLIDGYRTPTV